MYHLKIIEREKSLQTKLEKLFSSGYDVGYFEYFNRKGTLLFSQEHLI